MAVILYIFSRP